MQTNPAVEQNKIVRWSESPWNQTGIGKEKVYGGKDLMSRVVAVAVLYAYCVLYRR